MVFASNIFIVCMAIVLPIYVLLVGRFGFSGRVLLIFLSLAFYAYWTPIYLVILLGSIVGNFAVAQSLLRDQDDRSRRFKLWLAVIGNLGLLGYFKYFNFFAANIADLLGLDFSTVSIALPLGISFFTFQQVSFIADVHQRRLQNVDFLDYTLFIAFFPQLIAGPIVSQAELLPQLKRKKNWNIKADQFALGFFLFSVGLFKKSFLIDPYTAFVDVVFDDAKHGVAIGFIDGWTAAIGYSFQIYFDFSGYSDMAIGLALLFELRLPINFFSPYKAASIRDFWRRWHITLSRMLQRFLYIPFGGSRNGKTRTVIALIGTMTIGGLWHGAGWQFVIWGLLHGIMLSVCHLWAGFYRPRIFLNQLVQTRIWYMSMVVVTFAALAITWVFFRAEDVPSALSVVQGMLGMNGLGDTNYLTRGIAPAFPIYFFIVWAMPNSIQITRRFPVAIKPDTFKTELSLSRSRWKLQFRPNIVWAIVSAATFFAGWFSLSSLSPFIYFQF